MIFSLELTSNEGKATSLKFFNTDDILIPHFEKRTVTTTEGVNEVEFLILQTKYYEEQDRPVMRTEKQGKNTVEVQRMQKGLYLVQVIVEDPIQIQKVKDIYQSMMTV